MRLDPRLFLAGWLALALLPQAEGASGAWFSTGRSPLPIVPPATYPGQPAWTLESAVQRALDANPDVVAARKEIEQQEGIKLQYKARLLPHGGLNYRYQDEQNSLLMFLPTIPVYPLTTMSWLGSVGIQQTILNVSVVKEARQQRFLLERSVWLALDAALRTTAKVKQAFAQLLYRRNVVAIREELLEASRLIAESVGKQARAGEIPPFQALSSAAEFETAKAELAQAREQSIEAQEQLRMLLNLPSRTEQEGLPVLGDLELSPFDVPYEEALRLALTKKTDLQAAHAAVRAADASVAAAKASFFPTVDGFAQYEVINNVYLNFPQNGWLGGAQGQWALFNIVENNGKIEAQKAARQVAEVRRTQIEMEIPAQLRALYQQLERAREAALAQRRSTEDASKGLDQAVRLFQSGETNWVQSVTARQALLRARIGLEDQKFRYAYALAQIEYAVGGQLPRSRPGGNP
ncbi:MAG: TolC family protein [Methylacidiphilaceae bacterium]|nr:TolC family protein [Candidatus Methylacidiphilaceae bacterium]